MTHSVRVWTARAACLSALLIFSACDAGKSDGKSEKKLAKEEKKQEKAEKRKQREVDTQGAQITTRGEISQFATAGCDESLWTHVYDPARLEKLATCVSVKGKIVESSANDDGDQHFLLQLDPGQDALLNERNAKKKNGDLVVEIVCANPVTLAKAKVACSGYRNRIGIPAVGSRVTVTGAYVIDSHNGWAEIHPATKLQPER